MQLVHCRVEGDGAARETYCLDTIEKNKDEIHADFYPLRPHKIQTVRLEHADCQNISSHMYNYSIHHEAHKASRL